jgi:hypothetical protein
MITPNYARPEISTATRRALQKPERAARKADARKVERARALTRTQACDIVWRREGGTDERPARCQRCKRKVSRDVAGWRDERAQFNENPPRSLGGDFGAPSGGHAPSKARMEEATGGPRLMPHTDTQSIRNGLVDRGFVTAVGDCIGRYGKKVTIWAPREGATT